MLRRLQSIESFGTKVVLVITLISGLAVLAIATMSGIRDYFKLKDTLTDTIASQSLIVAMNSGAPMAFRDVESATEALAALRFADTVSKALLVDPAGDVFARYEARGRPVATADVLLPAGHWERPEDYVLVLPVSDQGGEHGRLQVHYLRDTLRREALSSALLTVLLSASAMLLAFFAARRIKNVLVAPVRELDRVARHVADTDDYSLRAQRFGNDELGRFTERFNLMLGRIESSRDELVAAHDSAQQASRLKDEFVATLSHELRTPMSPILAWAHMLRLRSQGRADLEEGIAAIERNARMLVQIIDDLLDMSRIISGNLRLDVQTLDLRDTIRAATDTVAATAESRQVRLQTVLDPNAVTVRGDPARLQQVIWNLLTNAIKFTPRGGRVQISLQRIDSHVEISVSDTGIGIKPAFLPLVFDRFRQADGSSTREYGGLGLGLSIVKQLVELHGGTVTAESPGEGLGSSFVVCLPLASLGILAADDSRQTHSANVSSPRLEAESPSLRGIRVLLVEDHADMRQLVRATLSAAGAEVREAECMAEALDLFGQSLPDVVVSDIGMPGGDGHALIRAIRERSAGDGGAVPAIALTAYARSEDRTRALLAGFQLHVAKPVEPMELLAAVASLANNAHHRGELG